MDAEHFEGQVKQRTSALRLSAQNLCGLATEILNYARAPNSDDFGVMGICFLSKQTSHLKGLLMLEAHRDSELIARSMIEGLAYFLWAHNGKDVRPRRWREWAYVHNHKLVQDDPELYEGEISGLHAERSGEAGRIRESFYNSEARTALASGKKLPKNPFIRDWTGLSITAVINEVSPDHRGLFIYYRRFSEWHHWNFAGIARALNTNNKGTISYRAPSDLSHAQALVVGFQCLFQIAELVNKHLNLGFDTRLERLKEIHLQIPPPSQNSAAAGNPELGMEGQ